VLYPFLIFISFIEAIIGFVLLAASKMKFREPVKKRIIVALFVMVCCALLYLWVFFCLGIGVVERLAILFILIPIIAWFLICSGDSLAVTIFNFLTDVNIFFAISFFSDVLTFHTHGIFYQIEYMIIRAVIFAIILPFMFKIIRPRFRQLVAELSREWLISCLVPLTFLVLQIFMLYYPMMHWYRENYNGYIILAAYVLFVAVYYILYVQANGIVEKYALEQRQLLVAQQDKLWNLEFARQKEEICLADQQRHDMHHHNAVIMNMVRDGNYEELITYMEHFDKMLDTRSSTVYCKNLIVNSICNFYAKRAEAEYIKINYNMSVPEDMGIDSIDLTCIFGNLIENAMEGCLRLPESGKREISVIAKYVDKRLRLQVENTCRDDIIFDGEIPKTQKQVGGMGIRSIVYTAERYDGTAGFSVNEGRFTAQIVLNSI